VVARRPSIAKSAVATGKGDDGTTGLLYGGRIAKDDLRVDAYGAVDEGVAALGVARVALREAGLAELAELILRYQRELFVVGAELATNPTAVDRLQDAVTRVSEGMVSVVESDLALWEGRMEMPREFVVPGETAASAALEVARTVVRRAERRIVTLNRASEIDSPWIIPYVNRLADLLWVLARAAEQAEQAVATPARQRA
jgi:cob(I)alamin adenosyltransferase